MWGIRHVSSWNPGRSQRPHLRLQHSRNTHRVPIRRHELHYVGFSAWITWMMVPTLPDFTVTPPSQTTSAVSTIWSCSLKIYSTIPVYSLFTKSQSIWYPRPGSLGALTTPPVMSMSSTRPYMLAPVHGKNSKNSQFGTAIVM